MTALDPARTARASAPAAASVRLAMARAWLEAVFAETGATDLILRLTLLTLIFHGFASPFFFDGLTVAAIVLIAFPRALRVGHVWLLIFLMAAITLGVEWVHADNHKYLIVYWLGAVTLAAYLSGEADQRAMLRAAASYLLVFTMGFAVIQKTLSASYLSGAFFEFQLLIDDRFAPWMRLLTGLDAADLAHNAQLRDGLMSGGGAAGALISTPGVERFAQIITWVNYLDQLGVVVLAFLSHIRRLEILKHILLIAFILGTYLFAPVIGFGWLICIFGLATTRPGDGLIRAAYAGAFIVIGSYAFLGVFAP